MRPGEEWVKVGELGWRVMGCPAKTPQECYWLIPAHGKPEHFSGSVDEGRRQLLARAQRRGETK